MLLALAGLPPPWHRKMLALAWQPWPWHGMQLAFALAWHAAAFGLAASEGLNFRNFRGT